MNIPPPPGLLKTLFTFGIARASWIAETNRTLNQGGAGFLFAWLLSPFALYGLAERLNKALAAAGSSHRESAVMCFLFNGWPLFGSRMRLKRGTERLNEAQRTGQHAGGAPVPA